MRFGMAVEQEIAMHAVLDILAGMIASGTRVDIRYSWWGSVTLTMSRAGARMAMAARTVIGPPRSPMW
jgi:hypothetical protein